MDARTKTKMVNALMTTYISTYEDKHGRKPTFNRNTEKWGFGYMLEDLGAETMATLEYYFSLKREHTPQDLLRNYHDINKWMSEDAEDEVYRAQLREKTKKKVEEYEKKWQKPSN